MVGGGDGLADGSKIGPPWGRGGWERELGNGVEGRSILTSAVKFSLEVEQGDFDIAQGHADVFVSEQLHESGQADTQA